MRLIIGYILMVTSIMAAIVLLAHWIFQPVLTQIQLAIKYWYLVLVMVVCAFSGGYLVVEQSV